MKDSGIEWIGDVPIGWETIRVKYCGTLSANGVDKKIIEGEAIFKSVHYMDVYKNSLKEIGNSEDYLVVSANESKAESAKLKQGDVLITSSSETPDDIGHSVVITEDLINTIMGYHLMRFRPIIALDYHFEKYFFGSHYMRQWFTYRATGMTRYGLSYSDYADAIVILPPQAEQRKIANFLDDKCAKIDRTIEQQKTVIEKLKAYKQSVITEAVTKGLDPNVPMKDSGIEWIGMMPEKWIYTSLGKVLCGIKDGTHTSYQRIDEGRYLLSAKNVYNDGLRITNNESCISEEDYYAITNCGYPRKGDVLLTTIGGSIGRVLAYSFDEIYAFQRSVIFLRPKFSRISSNFLVYLLLSEYVQAQMKLTSSSSAQDGIYSGEITKYSIVFSPSILEQQQITDYLDQKCAAIDTAVQKKQSLIDKLTEYKKSLIYEAVTGKLEV